MWRYNGISLVRQPLWVVLNRRWPSWRVKYIYIRFARTVLIKWGNLNVLVITRCTVELRMLWKDHPIVVLIHWGRVMHICVSKQTIIGSDNGLSPGQRQAIIWTNAGILLIGTLGTNFGEIFIEVRIFSFKKISLKVSSAKWLPCCLGRNELNGN